MPSVVVDGRTLDFPDKWVVGKLDDWSFRRDQVSRFVSGLRVPCSKCQAELRCANCKNSQVFGMKAMDVLAIAPGGVAWLIELKDFETQRRAKLLDLGSPIQ